MTNSCSKYGAAICILIAAPTLLAFEPNQQKPDIHFDKEHIERLLINDNTFVEDRIDHKTVERLLQDSPRPSVNTLMGETMSQVALVEKQLKYSANEISRLLQKKLVNAVVLDKITRPPSKYTPLVGQHSTLKIAEILSQTKIWSVAQFSINQQQQSTVQNLVTSSRNTSDQYLTRTTIREILEKKSKWFLLDLTTIDEIFKSRYDSYSRTDTLVAKLLDQHKSDDVKPAVAAYETENKKNIGPIEGSLTALRPTNEPKQIQVPAVEANEAQNPLEPVELSLSKLERLEAAIFERPADLQLNLELFGEYLNAGELESAEVTLDRILIFDPSSRYARILLAETRLKLGKLPSARSILIELLNADDLPDEMRIRADALLSQIDKQLDPTSLQTSVMVASGRVNNVFSAPDDNRLSFFGISIPSTTPNEHAFFKEISTETTWSYVLPSLKPQLVTLGGAVSHREYDDQRVTDTTTTGLSTGYKQQNDWGLFSANAFYSKTLANSESYNRTRAAAFNISTPLSDAIQMNSSLSYALTDYDLEAYRDLDTESIAAAVSIGGALDDTYWTISASGADANARNPAHSTDTTSLSLKLTQQIGVCTTGLTETQSWSKAKAPLTFVHPTIRKSQTTTKSAIDITCLIPSGQGFNLKPFITASKTESRSGLSNYDKTSSEVSAGVKVDF